MFDDFHVIDMSDVGPLVMCDLCGKDYTRSEETGGFLFQSKAVCPDCAPRFEKSAKNYNEEHLIKARCPKNLSFADWIRNDVRESEKKWIVLSPDGFNIERDCEYDSYSQAKQACDDYYKRYESQGYYSTMNREHIPLSELSSRCSIVEST